MIHSRTASEATSCSDSVLHGATTPIRLTQWTQPSRGEGATSKIGRADYAFGVAEEDPSEGSETEAGLSFDLGTPVSFVGGDESIRD